MIQHFDDIFLNRCAVYRFIFACMEVEDVIDKLKDSQLLDASVVLAIDQIYLVIEHFIIGFDADFDGLTIVDNLTAYRFSTLHHLIIVKYDGYTLAVVFELQY